jgi:hypothetical protein
MRLFTSTLEITSISSVLLRVLTNNTQKFPPEREFNQRLINCVHNPGDLNLTLTAIEGIDGGNKGE